MTNQFLAKIRFDAIAWRAHDRETGAVATIIDHGYGRAKWSVQFEGGAARRDGSSATPAGARAACRRVIARVAASRKA